jgi:sugar phosphate isomerase/epimerase
MISPVARAAVIASALSSDPREAASEARGMGFSGILFDAASSAIDLTQLSQTGRREFRQVLSSNNLELVGLRYDLGPKGLGPGANVERAIERLDQTMETAAGMMSPMVCVDLGILPPAPPAVRPPAPKVTQELAGLIILPTELAPPPPPPPVALSAADRALADQLDGVLAEICAKADRYNVVLAVRSELAGFDSLLAVIERARCPWLGIDLDPVAVLRDPWPLDEIFSRIGSLIRHVRTRDAVVGADKRTRPAPIGQGSTNWAEFRAALDAAGYHGWITVDPTELADRQLAAANALEYLRPTI